MGYRTNWSSHAKCPHLRIMWMGKKKTKPLVTLLAQYETMTVSYEAWYYPCPNLC